MADVGIKITAIDDTKGAFGSIDRSLGGLKSAAAGVSSSLAGLASAFTVGAFVSFVKSVNDGVDALNDIKDATGASIENISALEDIAKRTGTSLDTVGSALVKLNQSLNGAKPGSDTEKALTAIGLSVKDLKNLDPAEAFRRIAVELNKFADDGNKARLSQELFGKSLKEVAPLLKDVAESGALVATVTTEQAEAAERLNKQFFNLQANVGTASRALVSQLVPSLSVMADEFSRADASGSSLAKTLGESLAIGLDGMVRVGAGAAFVFKTIGREIGGVVAGLGALGEGGGIFSKDGRAAWLAVWDARAEDLARDVKAYNDLVNRISGARTPTVATSGASSGAKLPTVADIGSGPDKAALAAARAAAKAARDQAVKDEIEGFKLMQAAQEAYDKVLAESTKEREKYNEVFSKSADAVAQKVQDLEDEEAALALSTSANISLAQAIERVEIARLREKQAIELSYGNEQAAAEIQREIEQRQKLATLLDSKTARADNAKTAKAAADDWQKASDQIEQSLTDALFRGFESGKDFITNLRDTIVNAFKTMVLKPIVQAVVNPLAGAAASALGFSGAATAGTSAAASGFGGIAAAGGLAGLAGTFGSSLAAGFSGTMAAGFTGLGASLSGGLSAIATGSASSIAAGLGQIAGTLGPFALGAVALYGLAGGFKGEYVKSTGDANASFDPTGQRTQTLTAAQIGAGRYEATLSDSADKFVKDLNTTYLGTIKALGAKASFTDFFFGGNNSDGGKFTVGSGVGGVGSVFNSGELKSSDEAIKLAASRAVFAAVQSSELSAYLSKVFDGVTASTASQADLDAALGFAATLKQVRDSLTETRTPLVILQDTVAEAFTALGTSAATFKADFVGAIDAGITPEKLAEFVKLGQNLDALAQASGTAATSVAEATRSLADIKNERTGLQDQLDELTLTNVQLLDKQRNALDESNRALFDQVQTAQAAKTASQELADAQADAAAKVQALADQFRNALGGLGSTRFDLENQILGLQGNTGEVRQRTRTRDLAGLTEGLTDATQIASITAAYDYNLALQDTIETMQAASAAQEQAANAAQQAADTAARSAEQIKNAWQSVADSIYDEVARIRGLMGGSSAQSFAGAQAAFSITAAQAAAGDQGAAKLLPGLSQALLALAESQATSLAQLRAIQGQTAGTLEKLGGQYAGQYGLSIPRLSTGTNYVPADMLAMLHQGEAVVPAAYNPSNSGSNGNTQMVAELQALRVAIATLQKAADKTADSTASTNKTLLNVTLGGVAMQTQAV